MADNDSDLDTSSDDDSEFTPDTNDKDPPLQLTDISTMSAAAISAMNNESRDSEQMQGASAEDLEMFAAMQHELTRLQSEHAMHTQTSPLPVTNGVQSFPDVTQGSPTRKVSQGMYGTPPQNVSQGIPQGIPQGMPQGVPQASKVDSRASSIPTQGQVMSPSGIPPQYPPPLGYQSSGNSYQSYQLQTLVQQLEALKSGEQDPSKQQMFGLISNLLQKQAQGDMSEAENVSKQLQSLDEEKEVHRQWGDDGTGGSITSGASIDSRMLETIHSITRETHKELRHIREELAVQRQKNERLKMKIVKKNNRIKELKDDHKLMSTAIAQHVGDDDLDLSITTPGQTAGGIAMMTPGGDIIAGADPMGSENDLLLAGAANPPPAFSTSPSPSSGNPNADRKLISVHHAIRARNRKRGSIDSVASSNLSDMSYIQKKVEQERPWYYRLFGISEDSACTGGCSRDDNNY